MDIKGETDATKAVEELRQACDERGMRSIGLREGALRTQLTQWLQLSVDSKVPISLLVLSRAMTINVTKSPAAAVVGTGGGMWGAPLPSH